MVVVMLDNGRESFVTGYECVPVGIFKTVDDAELALTFRGFEPGADQTWWLGRRMAYLRFCPMYDNVDVMGGVSHEVSTGSADDTD